MSRFDPSHVDVEHFLDTLGVENITRATQQEMRFSCPFASNHAGGDESPSCYMNLDTSAFFCHGCKEKGTAVDMAAYVLQISPLESIRLLRNAYHPGGINPDVRDMVAEVKKILGEQKVKVNQPVLDPALTDSFAVNWSKAWFAYKTGIGFAPCDYFFERGFSPEALNEWGFGWDDRTRRVVFPIHDASGQLIGFKGRACDDRKPKYLVLGDGPEPGRNPWGWQRYYPSHVVFGAHRYQGGAPDLLVICEGELNAIAVTQKTGLPAVAINGSFFSEFHAKIIRRIVGEQGVVLFFDDDEAGKKCTWGWENSRGEWHPGVVELLSPHMNVQLLPPHEKDAADMSGQEIQSCVDDARDYLLVRLGI